MTRWYRVRLPSCRRGAASVFEASMRVPHKRQSRKTVRRCMENSKCCPRTVVCCLTVKWRLEKGQSRAHAIFPQGRKCPEGRRSRSRVSRTGQASPIFLRSSSGMGAFRKVSSLLLVTSKPRLPCAKRSGRRFISARRTIRLSPSTGSL